MRRRDRQRLERELEGLALDLVRSVVQELFMSARYFGNDSEWLGVQRIMISLENLEDVRVRIREVLAKAEKLQGRK